VDAELEIEAADAGREGVSFAVLEADIVDASEGLGDGERLRGDCEPETKR
jgi:hypothetical protein